MSASALQRAASVIGAVGGGSGGSGSGRSTPTPTRSASLRSVQNASAGSGTAAAAAAQAGPHSLSLKVMRISAPSLVRAQDRAYFEVPDESFPSSSVSAPEAGAEVAADKADAGKVHAKARAQASALAQDISLAEAGEMQRLYASLAQASSEDGSPGASSQSNIGAAERALRSAAAADMLSNQSALEAASRDPIMRDWPTSTALVLPSSFGTIHLGEAFQAYICLNNESSEPVKDVSLLVEIQQAEKEEELALADKGTLPSSSSNPSVILARLSTTPSPLPLTGQDPDADTDASIQEAYAQSLLQPQSKLETTVRHDMRKPGGYVLGCTISYQAWLPAPRMAAGGFDANQNAAPPGQWVERSFRKSYRFAVPTCPLTVRSKAHVFTPSSVPSAPLPSAHLTPASASEADMREAILLEVQIRNDSPRALVLEQASLETDLLALGLLQNPEAAAAAGLGPPFAGWDWESLDRPWLKYSALKSDGRTDATTDDLSTMSRRHFGFSPDANQRLETADDETGLWEDEDQWLLSSDARQFIFRLTPARQPSTTISSDDTSSPSESGTSTKAIRLQDLVPPTPPFAAPTTPSSTSAATFNRPMSSASTITSPPPFGGKSLPATPTTRFSMPASGVLHGAIPPLMTPLGKLDIAWRMAGPGGEPGRLQTSMLFWRRDLREPAGGGLPQSPAGAGPNVHVARR